MKKNKWMRFLTSGSVISLLAHVLIVYLLIRFVAGRSEKNTEEFEIIVHDFPIKEVQEPTVDVAHEVSETSMEEPPPLLIEPPLSNLPEPMAIESLVDSIIELDDFIPERPIKKRLDTQMVSKPKIYTGRTQVNRDRLVKKYGGSHEGQQAVMNALLWLKSVQMENGSWVNSPAHTGLATLCFLARGETTESTEFGPTVQKALGYLVHAEPEEGKLSNGSVYTHGIVTYCLSEAYGMTRNAFLRRSVEERLKIILAGQQKGGGFDYKYKKGKRWDLSITGWQVQALKAGYVAGFLEKPISEALNRAVNFIKSTYKNKKFGYSSPGSGGNMTGIGVLCLQLWGAGKSDEVKGAYEKILTYRLGKYKSLADDADWASTAPKYLYGWYYDTQAMLYKGKSDWKNWNKVFQNILVKNQDPKGFWEVDKAPYGFTGDLAGRVYCTTLCCLQLEVYYRYLPSYKISARKDPVQMAEDVKDEEEDFKIIIE